MKSTRGFTVIELLIVVAVLAAASIIFFVQKNHLEVASRDEMRKTSINAMYYALEEVYYENNNAYPRSVTSENLPSIDPALFKDTRGVKIGESASEFRYEPLDCIEDKCSGYTLRTVLENEDDYIKKNRSN